MGNVPFSETASLASAVRTRVTAMISRWGLSDPMELGTNTSRRMLRPADNRWSTGESRIVPIA